MTGGRSWSVRRLAWFDPELGRISLPKREMVLRTGFGSGLATRRGDPPGTVWAVCDRGPNLKAKALSERYGVDLGPDVGAAHGARIMPRTDLGPAIAELRVSDDEVSLVRTIRLMTGAERPLPGLPLAGSEHSRAEPAFDLEGGPLRADPCGTDSEGLVALSNGGFWVGDEYGPSLLRFDAEGRLIARWLPAGLKADGEAVLPAIAARRQINRGFEALAISPDEKWLVLAFQSPLAHPDVAAHRQARHVRLWQMDATTGAVAAQYLYPLDRPDSFGRDREKGAFGGSDIKVSELLWCGDDRLVVLERGSETTKIYEVGLDPALAIGSEHLEVETRPTVEEMSAGAALLELPVLSKELLFSSDAAPEVAADLEGMAWLSPTDLLLVSDNDFGVEGAETSFWLVSFAAPPSEG